MPRNKKNDTPSETNENDDTLLDADAFPDDGSEPSDDGDENDDQADPELDQDFEPEPAPPPSRPRRNTVLRKVRTPRAPRAPRKPRVRTVTTIVNEGDDEGTSETSTTERPSILKLLGGRVSGGLTIRRSITKGRYVAADDTGILPGTWQDSPDLADVIRARFGGGRYVVTGVIPGHKEPVTEELDLAGESKPLVEDQQSPPNGEPFLGGDSLIDDDEWVRREQQWYRWIPEKKTYIWTRGGDPTVPMPNHGLPPGVSSINTGADWWNTKTETPADPKPSSELSELKALFMQQMNDRKDREAAEQRRIDAEIRRYEREAADRKAEADRREQAEIRRLEREAADRKAEADRRDAERREEAQRRRDEIERQDRQRREDAEKRAAELKEQSERRDRELKEFREMENARRADERALQERLFTAATSAAKQDPTGSLKNLLGLAAGMRDLLGMGGERSEFAEKVELIQVGTQMVANNILPAFADLVSAWRHGRPAESPQIEQIPEQEPVQISGPVPEQVSSQQQPQPAPSAPRPPMKELSTAHLLDLVHFLTNFYKAGHGPRAAFVGVQSFAQGRNIPYQLVKDALSKLTVTELDSGLANAEGVIPAGLPIRDIVIEARAVLQSADAKRWFQTFLDTVAGRETKTSPEEPKP